MADWGPLFDRIFQAQDRFDEKLDELFARLGGNGGQAGFSATLAVMRSELDELKSKVNRLSDDVAKLVEMPTQIVVSADEREKTKRARLRFAAEIAVALAAFGGVALQILASVR